MDKLPADSTSKDEKLLACHPIVFASSNKECY